MCDQACLNSAVAKALAVYQNATGSSTVPSENPIPGNATDQQILCTTHAYLLYILDLILCLDLNEPQLSQCTTSARDEYNLNFAACFPE